MRKFAVIIISVAAIGVFSLSMGAFISKSAGGEITGLSTKGERLCEQVESTGSIQFIVETDVETLIKLAACDSPMVRRGAVYTLGERRALIAVAALIQRLEDRDRHTRRIAARALGKIGDARATAPLIRSLEDKDEALAVRCNAAWALGMIADPRAGRSLEAMTADSEKRLKSTCLKARKNHLTLMVGGANRQ